MHHDRKIFIFVPECLPVGSSGFLRGFVQNDAQVLMFYVTSEQLSEDATDCVGWCGGAAPQPPAGQHWLQVANGKSGLGLTCFSDSQEVQARPLCIQYSYADFSNSDVVSLKSNQYGKYFETLSEVLRGRELHKTEPKPNALNSHQPNTRNILHQVSVIVANLKVWRLISYVLQYLYTSKHLFILFTTFAWIWRSAGKKKRSFKVVNAIVVRLVDVILGVAILHCLSQFEDDLSRWFTLSAHEIISSLRTLLKFLMGSPVGLKLNYAFNSTLGNFFLHHISLWWTFLRSMNSFLNEVFQILVLPSVLGLSLQMAIISDVFAIFTFHVYCIYIYAARLYGLQIQGLVSLWRLFIGRKYNPLRERVDSFQYSHHQLFIGTLAFTILLFLLPTTLLYYSVFVTLRLCVILMQRILARIRYILQCLPLYPTFLWLKNSKSVAGTICLNVVRSAPDGPVVLNACLKADSWLECYRNSLPKTLPAVSPISWASILHNVFTGTPI